jgi:ADP-ribosylglycohydrolase
VSKAARSAVLGALVADAASLGLHWIYDPGRIADVAGERPEFLEPDLRHYHGTSAYFAHKGKRAGDSTHYGEQLLVLLRSLAATGGAFDPADYERRFVASFGPGGTWVGYIDYATRETLRNLDAAERAALSAARAFDLGGYEEDRALMEAKVMASVQRWRGEALARAMAKAVRITHGDDAALIAVGQEMARAVERAREGFHGADDAQLPAVSKLPALAPRASELVEPAVRVTNNSDDAVAWARPIARMLDAAVQGATPREAADAVADGVDPAQVGIACPLPEAVPLVVALLRDATDFASTVRANLFAGGDSAGRAIVLGAVLGAAFGVPPEWSARTHAVAEAEALMRR